MNIEELFKKAEEFFVFEGSEQDTKESKREKLKCSLEEKIASIKNKIKETEEADEKSTLKKQLDVLLKFLEKLE